MNEDTQPPPPAVPPAPAVAPRTHVNSAMTIPYVQGQAAPSRPGADDHKKYTTKGNPT